MSNPKIERQLDQYTTEVNSLEAKAEALKTNAEKHLYQLSLLNEKYLELHEKRQRIHFLREKAETLKQKLAQGDRSNRELRSFLNLRRAAYDQACKKLDQEKSWLHSNQELFERNKTTTDSILDSISMSIHQAVEVIDSVYPIRKVDEFQYTIRHIYFPSPNIQYQERNADGIATALGWVCRIILLLCQILCIPSRFRIFFLESRSTITDPFTDTVYPLYEKGQPLPKFEFGVHLLNKSIIELLETQGLVARHFQMTLGNLKMFMDSFKVNPNSSVISPSSQFSASSYTLSLASGSFLNSSEYSSSPSISPTLHYRPRLSMSLLDEFTANNGQLVRRSSLQPKSNR